MKEFIVYENKRKVTRLLASAFIMFLASGFVLFLGYKDASLSFRAIGSAGLVFFGYSGAYLAKRTVCAFREPLKAVLVKVNHEGVSDFSSKSSKGLVKWEDISSVKITRWFTQQNIVIELKSKPALSSKVRKVQINLDTADASLKDLMTVIEKGLKASK